MDVFNSSLRPTSDDATQLSMVDGLQTTGGNDVTTQEGSITEHHLYTVSKQLVVYGGLLVTIIGVTANCLTIAVLAKKGIHNTTVTVYLSALAVVDSLVLLLDWMNNWLKSALNVYVLGFSDVGCRLYRFIFPVSYTLAAWLVVLLTFERLIAIVFPLRSVYMNSSKKALKILLGLIVIICGFQAVNLWVWNMTEGVCKRHEDFTYYHRHIHMWLQGFGYSYIPSLCLICMNTCIVASLVKARKNLKSMIAVPNKVSKETKNLAKMVVLVSLTYLVLTVPLAVYYFIQYNLDQFIEQTPTMAVAESIIMILGTMNNAINFFLYVLSSASFRAELIKMVCPCRRALTQTDTANLSTTKTSKDVPTMSNIEPLDEPGKETIDLSGITED